MAYIKKSYFHSVQFASIRFSPVQFGSVQFSPVQFDLAQINLTAEQRQKIADISHCVDKLGVKIQVVGHTDNTGQADNNMVLGQGRADFAKNYLIRNGILGVNIEATSKGQTQPIADNNTEEGRKENRRTVITIN